MPPSPSPRHEIYLAEVFGLLSHLSFCTNTWCMKSAYISSLIFFSFFFVVLALTCIIKSVVAGQAPVILELRNTPGIKHKQTNRWYTYISQLTQFIPPPETYKVKSGVSLRCVRSMLTGAYISLLAPGKKRLFYRLPPKTDYHVYITPIIGTYHYEYARHTQVN